MSILVISMSRRSTLPTCVINSVLLKVNAKKYRQWNISFFFVSTNEFPYVPTIMKLTVSLSVYKEHLSSSDNNGEDGDYSGCGSNNDNAKRWS